MSSALPSDDLLYQALLDRDSAYEGVAYVGVVTTGIFCRLTCPARKPRRENVRFFGTIGACLDAGFRPCRRCRPFASAEQADPVVGILLNALEADPARRWAELDLVRMGYDPSTIRRSFKRHFGTTFLEMARRYRLRAGAVTLSSGGRVLDAQLDAGFASGSGFRTAFARLLGQAPAAFSGREPLRAEWLTTPIGPMVAVASEAGLHLLEFYDRYALPTELRQLQERFGAIGVGRFGATDRVESELSAYFRRADTRFDVPLVVHGSAFTRQVWDELRRIPSGETESYAAIADRVGRPTAVRAVARANGANQLALIIPCHRVIGSDGSLTGYGGGIWRKRWLLEHERAAAAPPAETHQRRAP